MTEKGTNRSNPYAICIEGIPDRLGEPFELILELRHPLVKAPPYIAVLANRLGSLSLDTVNDQHDRFRLDTAALACAGWRDQELAGAKLVVPHRCRGRTAGQHIEQLVAVGMDVPLGDEIFHLLVRLGSAEADRLATQVALLLDGAIAASLVRGDPAFVRAARDAADTLIDTSARKRKGRA